MRYYVLNRDDDTSALLTEQFRREAGERGLIEDREHPDIVVSIGGDGTLLQAFHTYLHRLEHVAFVGVHTGHLGFFADWRADEISQLVDKMALHPSGLDERQKVKYPLLEIALEQNNQTHTYFALNEVTIKSAAGTLVAQVNINNEQFEMFRGDGVCVSTPSGSTAYNKSLGGTVVHPTLESIQITEIASINNRVFRTLGSSVLLPRHHYCDIIPRAGQNLHLTIDHLSETRESVASIRCRVADRKVSFARFRPFPFWERVREAFIHNGDDE